MKAVVFDIVRNSFVDGPGIRTTIFFKGCNLKCAWCHNPESQNPIPEMLFWKDKCINCGKCKQICPHPQNCALCGKCTLYCPVNARKICGKEYTVDEILKEIVKDKTFYDVSNGGVTFSGGECMLQIDFLSEILKKCKENNIHTAIDTAGCVPFENFEKILPYTDLFLYDIKCADSQKHKEYIGCDNNLILGNLKKLFDRNANIWIRIPLIQDINATDEDILEIKNILSSLGSPQKIELLPFHTLGENKYFAIQRSPVFFKAPTSEQVKTLEKLIVK